MKLASVITGRLTNFFQRRGEIEPRELIKALEREVVKQKTWDNRVPNAYTIYLGAEDCHRLNAARMIKSLHEAVERKVIRENCFMDGLLIVKIKKMTADDKAIAIATGYVEEPAQDTIDLENDVLSHTLIEGANANDENDGTLVADKMRIVETMRTAAPRKVEYDLAVITDFAKAEIVCGEKQIYLGRKETNDFVIDDEGASRIHAYVAYERHRHVLYDAGSLNGTWVNKTPVSRHELRNGDKILIGNTRLTYKVL